MGEKIRDIKNIRIADNLLTIEQNKGTHIGSKYDIHIQNPTFRLNITEDDFFKMSSAIIYATENLKSYKRGTEHE